MTAEETFNQLQTFLRELPDQPVSERGCDLLLARDPTDEEDDCYDVGRVKVEGDIARELEQLVQEKVENKLSALNNSENDTKMKNIASRIHRRMKILFSTLTRQNSRSSTAVSGFCLNNGLSERPTKRVVNQTFRRFDCIPVVLTRW